MACTGRKYKIKGLAAKIGVTYGTDSIPTAAANAIETVEGTISPLEAETVEHDIDRPGGGNNPTELVNKHILINVKVAVAGAGAAGDAPAYGVLLRACGYAEALNPGTDARYTRVVSNEEFADLYFWMDGALHKALGARGSFTVEFSKSNIPYYNFSMMALYAGPVTDANPVLNLSGFSKPKAMSNAMTNFSFHSVSPPLESLTLNGGQEVIFEDKPGCESVLIVDQKPGGSMAVDALDLASFDPFGIAVDGDLDTTSIIHGVTAGNIVQFVGDYSEISTVNYTDHNKKLGYSHDYRFLPDPAGVNPDFTIVVT